VVEVDGRKMHKSRRMMRGEGRSLVLILFWRILLGGGMWRKRRKRMER